MIWMRTAGLPTFRKLWFRNDNDVLRAGTYSINIYMSQSDRSRDSSVVFWLGLG
jgi:hypothetical protein